MYIGSGKKDEMSVEMYKISGCKVHKMKTVHVAWDMMLIYERQFNVMPYYSIVVQHNCTFHYITTNTS